MKEATKIRVLREVPKPPEEWNDILSEYNDKQSPHSSKIRLLPAQAKNLELSIIWALKGTNYIDYFQQYTKSVLQDQSTNLSALQEWLKLNKAPSEVEALLTVSCG